MIHWRRLFQPRKPAFWLMLALNALSSVLMWIVQNRSLVPVAALLVGVFAIGNAVLGMRLAWQLLQTSPEPEDAP